MTAGVSSRTPNNWMPISHMGLTRKWVNCQLAFCLQVLVWISSINNYTSRNSVFLPGACKWGRQLSEQWQSGKVSSPRKTDKENHSLCQEKEIFNPPNICNAYLSYDEHLHCCAWPWEDSKKSGWFEDECINHTQTLQQPSQQVPSNLPLTPNYYYESNKHNIKWYYYESEKPRGIMNPRLRAANKAHGKIFNRDIGQKYYPFFILHGRNMTQLRENACRKGAVGKPGHVWGRAGGSLRLVCWALHAPSALPSPTSLLQQFLPQPAMPHRTVHILLSAQLLYHCLQKPIHHRSAKDASPWDCPSPTGGQSHSPLLPPADKF